MGERLLTFLETARSGNRPHRIGLVIADLQPGGAERQAFLFASKLSERGVEARVFALRHQGTTRSDRSIAAEFPGVAVTICESRPAQRLFHAGEALKRVRQQPVGRPTKKSEFAPPPQADLIRRARLSPRRMLAAHEPDLVGLILPRPNLPCY